MFILVGTVGVLYNKVSSLNMEIGNLTSKIRTLNLEKRKLLSKQQANENKKNKNKKRAKKHRKALIAKKLNRAKLKLAKAPASMVPVAGVAAVVAFTANDIHNYCLDIKEFRELEVSLFGSTDDEISEDEKILCGYDVEKELLPVLKSYSDDSTEWIVDGYNSIIEEAEQLIDEWF